MSNFLEKNLVKICSVASLILFISFGFGIYYHIHKKTFGAVPQTPAQFDTSLAVPQATSDTSMTLASGTLGSGATLSGFYCFTLDASTPLSEYECGTASTTSPTLITGITRGIDPQYGTTSIASLIRSHRVGADVRITDFPTIQQFSNIFNGQQGITNPILYSGVATSTLQSNNNYLASVGYVNSVAISGAANASLTQNGLVQQATALQLAAGTNIGSTGAVLFAPGGVFASSSSSTTLVPVTLTNGKISQGFLDLTQNFSFSGVLSSSATTTIAATSSAPLILRGITYSFPGTQVASTTLFNNGNGILTWVSPVSFGSATSTALTTSFTTTTTTLATLIFTPAAAERVQVSGIFAVKPSAQNGCLLSLTIDNAATTTVADIELSGSTATVVQSSNNFSYITSQLSASQHTFSLVGVNNVNSSGCTLANFTQFSVINMGN